MENRAARRGRWRMALWGTAAFLMLLPLVAMQFTDEVNWDETDFLVFSAMLAGACGALELAAQRTADSAYRAGAGLAVAAAFILVWMNLAVGIIGNENNPANLMYGGVLAVAILGAVMARFQVEGMAYALVATAIAQLIVAMIAIVTGAGFTASGPFELLALNGFFALLWGGSAALFRKAARSPAFKGAAP